MSWWAQCHASPGFYIAILGFWAFAMPFVKKDPSKAERAVWVIVGALLLVFEMRSLNQASADSREQRKKEDERSERVLLNV